MWSVAQAHGAPGGARFLQDNTDLLWVPQSDSMMPVGRQGPAGELSAAGPLPEALPFVSGLQPAAGHAPVLQGLPQLNGALQQARQSLPMPAADASGGGATDAAGTGSATTAEAVDKQAVAREKNRLAQRRFR